MLKIKQIEKTDKYFVNPLFISKHLLRTLHINAMFINTLLKMKHLLNQDVPFRIKHLQNTMYKIKRYIKKTKCGVLVQSHYTINYSVFNVNRV